MVKDRITSLGLLIVLIVAAFAPVGAQTSASYEIEGSAFNAGGHPSGGATMNSATFQISLDSLGEPLRAATLSSPSYSMEDGMIAAYPAPGEVVNLVFDDKDTLDWDAERSAGVYHLYRQESGMLPGPYGGTCAQQDLPTSTTTDAGGPPSGSVWLYLVTAENRLGEEGTRGLESTGSERPDTGACP